MTDVHVISDFLGAGKTTLTRTMVRSAFRSEKIIVIENDLGKAGVDVGLLKKCSLAVTGLSDGCICCSLVGDLEKTMERILKDYTLDVVLVELSGVGRLSDIIKTCLKQKDRGFIHPKRIITVVDIRSFDKYRKNYRELFEDQTAYADLILLSRQEEDVHEIQSVKTKPRKPNPEARVEADPWGSIPASVFRYGPRNSGIFRPEMEIAVSMEPVRVRSPREPSGEADFIRRHFVREVSSLVTIEWKESITEESPRKRVLRVVKHIEGEILRRKGIVTGGHRGLVSHYLPGSLNIEPVNIVGDQVCFIGIGLDE